MFINPMVFTTIDEVFQGSVDISDTLEICHTYLPNESDNSVIVKSAI